MPKKAYSNMSNSQKRSFKCHNSFLIIISNAYVMIGKCSNKHYIFCDNSPTGGTFVASANALTNINFFRVLSSYLNNPNFNS